MITALHLHLPAMFQNILFGYSETLAGDTPGPGKGRKASAEAETCALRTCLRHGFSQAQPVSVFPFTGQFLRWTLLFSPVSASASTVKIFPGFFCFFIDITDARLYNGKQKESTKRRHCHGLFYLWRLPLHISVRWYSLLLSRMRRILCRCTERHGQEVSGSRHPVVHRGGNGTGQAGRPGGILT